MGLQNGAKMAPKSKKMCQQIVCFFLRVWRWVLRGAPENSWGLKPTKPVPKSGQLVPEPAQLVPKAAQLVPKAAQLVAKSANLIGLRKVSRPKVCPIFKTPDQPPKRPGMLPLICISSAPINLTSHVQLAFAPHILLIASMIAPLTCTSDLHLL